MKKSIVYRYNRFALVLLFAMSLCMTSGCAMYDWLVQWVQKSFASDHDYDVSVVDCKHFQDSDDFFVVTSQLSLKINEGVRQGVRDVSQNQKFRNIVLADRIPPSAFAQFQADYFKDGTTYEQRTALLRQYCEKYKTNIIMWGATMGDDYRIAFIGGMYRRDLDLISQTPTLPLIKNVSERIQEKMVQDAMKNLLEQSLNDDPLGGTGGAVANDMVQYKEGVLTATFMALVAGLRMAGTSGYNTSSDQ